MEEFPDNSYEARRAKKVASAAGIQPATPEREEPLKLRGKVVRKKRPIKARFAEVFTGEDIRSVGSSLWFDTIVPAIQDAIEDALRDGISRVIRGNSEPRGRDRRDSGYRPNEPYTRRHNYQQYSSRRDERTRPPAGRRSRKDALDYRDIILDNRADADDILYRLEDKISRFGNVAIADLYNILEADEDDIDYTDHERGWYSARGFRVESSRDGFRLVFPRPEHLNN